MAPWLTVEARGTVDLARAPTRAALGRAGRTGALHAVHKRLLQGHKQLWAQRKSALLVLLQGMDTSGKDGVIRSVFSGLVPQALEVSSFGVPSAVEARHDFLWRYHARAPPAGVVGVFNRSWYEGVLVERVDALVPRPLWRARYRQIRDFERLLVESGTHVVKVMLHVSERVQAERLELRRTHPDKAWKHNPDDLRKHAQYDDYLSAYEDAINATRTAVPWHVVPADDKAARNAAVARIVEEALTEVAS